MIISQRELEQVALDCARGKGILIDEKLNTARQVRRKISKNALVVMVTFFILQAIAIL